MKISKENMKKIIEEIEFAIKQMKETPDPDQKLYYFSAVYGVMPRVFNFEFDEDLVFTHFVLSSVYNSINQRLKTPDSVILLPKEIFDRLEELTEKLLMALKKEEDICEILKDFILLSYVTTGNGYYLYKKGILKI